MEVRYGRASCNKVTWSQYMDVTKRDHSPADGRSTHLPSDVSSISVITSEPRLVVDAVSREFGGIAAVSNVSFDVMPNEIHGLIGPNGAGKTTLFNMVSGIYPASSGRVLLNSRDITRLSAHQIAAAGIARTFQSLQLFSRLTVLENVRAGQSTYAACGLTSLLPIVAERRASVDRSEVIRLLEDFSLEGYADLRPSSVPYAAQRRVEIARAVASRPQVIMLDEPAGGLNDAESAQLCSDIAAIRDRGIAVLLVEHDMSVVMAICDRVTVLNFGEVLVTDTPEAVQSDSRVRAAYLGGA